MANENDSINPNGNRPIPDTPATPIPARSPRPHHYPLPPTEHPYSPPDSPTDTPNSNLRLTIKEWISITTALATMLFGLMNMFGGHSDSSPQLRKLERTVLKMQHHIQGLERRQGLNPGDAPTLRQDNTPAPLPTLE